jgi:serine/threonine protein kinase
VPTDSPQLRSDLMACLPSLVIEEVAAESGQRVVYFGRFLDAAVPDDIPANSSFLRGWESWGRVVVKVVANAAAETLTRLQAESSVLSAVRSHQFPALRFSNLFVDNPVTDDPLPTSLFVSIEEFIESQPLSSALDAYIGKSTEVAKLALGIAQALEPLWNHQRAYVHRDIKPANILLRPDGTVVIIDLGIVRETGAPGITKTGWGKAPLTVDYASPEQIANDKDAISYKTDFFAIGVLMYRLLSGRHPFRTRTDLDDYAVATAVEMHDPPTLETLCGVDTATSKLVHWLLRKDPFRRPRTPALLTAQLRDIAGI